MSDRVPPSPDHLFAWGQRLRRLHFQFVHSEAPADPAERRQRQRAFRTGMLIICSLTAWLLAWLVYRWIVRPDWLQVLPPLLGELVTLVETAGAITLAIVWSGLGYRHWQRSKQPEWTLGSSWPPAPEHLVTVEELYDMSPKEFERYVAGLFREKGYKAVVRGRSGDHGVDLEVTSAMGREAIVQCKRYQNTVGEEIVRELYGVLVHEQVARAFLVTTADISEAAREWARGKPITLIDGMTLAAISASLRQRRENGGLPGPKKRVGGSLSGRHVSS